MLLHEELDTILTNLRDMDDDQITRSYSLETIATNVTKGKSKRHIEMLASILKNDGNVELSQYGNGVPHVIPTGRKFLINGGYTKLFQDKHQSEAATQATIDSVKVARKANNLSIVAIIISLAAVGISIFLDDLKALIK